MGGLTILRLGVCFNSIYEWDLSIYFHCGAHNLNKSISLSSPINKCHKCIKF